MNHIYEQKAKKYKYKYLKLKREIEYIGELEGGLSIDFKKNLNEKINKEVDERLQKLTIEEKKKLLNEEKSKKGYFFDKIGIGIGIHNNKGLEEKINEEIKIRLQNLESERLENERLENERLEEERLRKRIILKNQLILLKHIILTRIVPLYPNYIFGNITKEIINDNNILLLDENKININNNTPIGITQTDNVKNAVEKIEKNNEKSIYLPPIIKCYFQIDTDRELTLSKVDLSNLLIKCLQMNKKGYKYDENQILQLFNNLNNLSKNGNIFLHHMYNIYRNYIRQFEKNIDYYALTKVICDLYYDFYYNYIIENNLFSENENNLEKLFINLKNDFINNKIEKDNFLEQLNNIINAF
jgi:hypothetical protein